MDGILISDTVLSYISPDKLKTSCGLFEFVIGNGATHAGHTKWCRPMIRSTLSYDLFDKKRHHLIPAVLSCDEGYLRVD